MIFNSSLTREEKERIRQERYYTASQWGLMWRKLKKHKLAMISAFILFVFYATALFADFIAPQGLEDYSAVYSNAPPTKIHMFHNGAFKGPFIYSMDLMYDKFQNKIFKENKETIYPVVFFVKGTPYKLLGLIESDIHLFGIEEPEGKEGMEAPVLMVFGADQLGRDLFSRILIGSKVSMTVPLLGAIISFVLAIVIGGISGFYGGLADTVIQRLIEVISSFPTLPLWMALSAAIPPGISVTRVFVFITIIMSALSWPGLARIVRSKFLALKNEDYVIAAKVGGVGDGTIILKHLVPGFMSYLIVSLTLSIPGMILGETSMSFLGLGMRAPATSWGVLLQECQSISNIANCPWKLIPVIFVIMAVLAFNFLGDGLRDASDPYK